MTESNTTRWQIAALLLTITINTLNAADFWKGDLNYNGRYWDIGLKVNENGKWTFFSEALWRWDFPLDSASYDGNKLSAILPFDIGKISVTTGGQNLKGSITISGTNSIINIELEPATFISYERVDGFVHNNNTKIGVSLIKPEKRVNYPLITVIHGGGNSDRKSPPIWFLANYFASKGFGCLIYDKRGCGESESDWRKVDFGMRANDVVEGIKWAMGVDKKINSRQIGLFAVSQGTWISGLVASYLEEVDFVVNMVGPLTSPAHADAYALKSELVAAGWNKTEIHERLTLWDLSLAVTRDPSNEALWETLVSKTNSFKTSDWFKRDPYEPVRKSWFRDWYKLVCDYDPIPTLKNLNIPILWIYGNRDTQSDLAVNIAKLSDLQRTDNKKYTIDIYENTAHGLMGPVDEYGTEIGPVATPRELFPRVVSWVGSLPLKN